MLEGCSTEGYLVLEGCSTEGYFVYYMAVVLRDTLCITGL